MAYITNANLKRIVFNTDIKNLNITGQLYKIPIYFFSRYEEKELLAIQELLKDPEKYFTQIYIPIPEGHDTFTMVYEGKQPCFHADDDCDLLNSEYHNFMVPERIREQGKDKVKEFRAWFKSHEHLLNNKEVWEFHFALRWGFIVRVEEIVKGNSGITSFDNYSIEDLEAQIDTLIKEAGRYYYASPKNTTILKQYGKATHLGKSIKKLEDNTTGYSDAEVKAFLNAYYNTYKAPLKKMLIEYYRLKLNPNIELSGQILHRLGFRACVHCH